MFQDTYKSAYDKITIQGASEICEAQITEWIAKDTAGNQSGIARMLRPVVAVALVACLVVILGVPVAAKNIPQFYEMLERNAPGMADYLIPIQKTDSSQGIVLNLEAAKIEGNTAEVLVSFSDDGTGDYIHGMVDMYDSYHLTSYSGESNIGGCYFMEYDEAQDKAYFQIDLISSDGTFDTSKMEFSVHQLLTDCQSYTEEISLTDMDVSYDLKPVRVSGRSGMGEESAVLSQLTLPGDTTDPRPGHLVMDVPVLVMDPETMEVTAVAYENGILKVQLFRGNFKAADRHMKIYLLDEAGNQIYPNLAVGWQEEVSGETVSLEEFYFVISEEELAKYSLWGEGEVRAGSIKGEWSITFNVE